MGLLSQSIWILLKTEPFSRKPLSILLPADYVYMMKPTVHTIYLAPVCWALFFHNFIECSPQSAIVGSAILIL